MRIEIDGAPESEVVAAIVAAVESVVGGSAPAAEPTISAWRIAGIRDNLRTAPGIGPGAGWTSPSSSL